MKVLPDTQNTSDFLEKISPIHLKYVGIRKLLAPFKVEIFGKVHTLEGTIELASALAFDKRGVHMSRFVRLLYPYLTQLLSWNILEDFLSQLQEQLESTHCKISVRLNYPILQRALVSPLEAYQYYPITWEAVLDKEKKLKKTLKLELEYSSTCPCSAALAQHAIEEKNLYSVPHAQRSKAFVAVELNQDFDPEKLLSICQNAIKTETQVMVKRIDEQAFAQLNGQYLKFVEDATRLIHHALSQEQAFNNIQVECQHYESLHSFDVFAST